MAEVCTESKLGESDDHHHPHYFMMTMACGAVLWEAEFGGIETAASMVEWGLAPYRVSPWKLASLCPDIIITTVELGFCHDLPRMEAAVQAVCGCGSSRRVRLLNMESRPRCVGDVWEAIAAVAQEVNVSREKVQALIESLQRRVDVVRSMSAGRCRTKRVLLCTGFTFSPSAPSLSFIVSPYLVQLAGDLRLLSSEELGFPPCAMISWDGICNLAPDILIFANTNLDLHGMYLELAKHLHLQGKQCFQVVVGDGVHFLERSALCLIKWLEVLFEILYPESQPFGHEGTLWKRLD